MYFILKALAFMLGLVCFCRDCFDLYHRYEQYKRGEDSSYWVAYVVSDIFFLFAYGALMYFTLS